MRLPARDMRDMLQVGGLVGRLCWSIGYKSLADFEATMATPMADPDYQSIAGKFGDFFLPAKRATRRGTK